MRLAFRETPSDLILAAVIALAVLPLALADVGGALRFSLAVVLVLLLPGYAVLAFLFPRDGEMTWIHRLAISVGLSIACVALLGLLVDLTPWGLTLGSTTVALLLVSLAGCGLAAVRRLQVPVDERLGVSVELAPPRWQGLSKTNRLLAIAAAIAMASAVGAVAFGVANPPPPERYTELYLLDSSGAVLAYPLFLNTTDQGIVIVGVHNVEGRSMNYTIMVLLVTLGFAYNSTTKQNETVELSTAFLGSFPVNLPSAERSEQRYPFNITVVGDYLLRFQLYVGPPEGTPYRFVDLRVHVA